MKIYTNDLKNISTNWVAAILIGGLILLPSLYAWLNIAASWDPYGQTDQIPIGIVNEDKGTDIRGEKTDVGEELVINLKDNQSMDWHFVDRDQAMEKLEHGDYFAVIIIPEDFSENLGSVVTGDPEKARVEYFVNEKINAIAPKITEKGASVIVEEISSNFISTVNGVIFGIFNEIGLEIEKDLPDIKQFESYVFEMEEKLPEIQKVLEETLTDADNASGIMQKAQAKLPEVTKISNNGLETIDSATAMLTEAEKQLNDTSPKIKEDLNKAKRATEDINAYLEDIDALVVDFSDGETIQQEVIDHADDALAVIDTVDKLLEQTIGKIEDLLKAEEAYPELEEQLEQLNLALAGINSIQQQLVKVEEHAKELGPFIDDTKKEVEGILSTMKEYSSDVTVQLDDFISLYNDTIEPTIRKETARAKKTLADARGMLVDMQSIIPEVEDILVNTEGNLTEGTGTLEDVLAEYPYVNDKVEELASKIRTLQDEADIYEIIDLLQNDPDAEKGFFAEPVELEENKVFPIENYGTGMTPFYTVLSIWVGCLLLISLLSTDAVTKLAYSAREMYFGRLFTFLTIGFLQTIIVVLGDMWILNVEIAHPVWFVCFGLLNSFVFMSIVYTLVSVFGDVGKATAIVFLVLQIAGSGGTYPVALLPAFFQKINPFLPFNYAIDLMREAVGGIVWRSVFHDIIILVVFSILAILLGAFLKERINKRTNKLMEKSKEAGLFH